MRTVGATSAACVVTTSARRLRGLILTVRTCLAERTAARGGDVMANLRIMIVEDDRLFAAILGELLGDMGHEVCATEATEAGAVASAARLRPDLILVDGQLGEGDCVAAIARTRAVPHVFISGGALTAEALAPGAVILRKPFTDLMLEQAIARACTADTADFAAAGRLSTFRGPRCRRAAARRAPHVKLSAVMRSLRRGVRQRTGPAAQETRPTGGTLPAHVALPNRLIAVAGAGATSLSRDLPYRTPPARRRAVRPASRARRPP